MESYCAYCGRLRRRCHCHKTDSGIALFLARGGREYRPMTREEPTQWAVPPQVKRAERQVLRRRYHAWYRALAAAFGEHCANCGETERLAVDHVLPIAKGGRSRLDNLQLLCGTCNRLKGKLTIDCRSFNGPAKRRIKGPKGSGGQG